MLLESGGERRFALKDESPEERVNEQVYQPDIVPHGPVGVVQRTKEISQVSVLCISVRANNITMFYYRIDCQQICMM